MADLNTDVVGQVERLPIKPTEANALLPLYEAVSNSLHAIHERFGDEAITEKGRIDVTILRQDTDDGSIGSVVGFRITDNGIGLNEDNFRSFCTPFSRHKLSKGGKGVGRLGWLKVFENISVESSYKNGSGLEHRAFDFILRV